MYFVSGFLRYLTGEVIAPGDWVRTLAFPLGYWHHGIVRRLVPSFNGIYIEIIHNDKIAGISLTDWASFAPSGVVQLYRRPDSPEQATDIIRRADNQIGKPYNLFSQNCEHFTSWAYSGVPVSEQLQLAALIGIGALALKLAFSEAK